MKPAQPKIVHNEVFPREISWGNLGPVAILNVLVFGVLPAYVALAPFEDDGFGGIMNVFTKLFIFGGGWTYLIVWLHKVFWMAFTTQISAAGISQKYRKGWLEMEWSEVQDCRYDSFDYIISGKDGQQIHINWVLFKNWRQMEAFIQSQRKTPRPPQSLGTSLRSLWKTLSMKK